MSQISLSQCIEIKSIPGFYLEPFAARSLDRALKEFGKTLILTGAWRSLQRQIELFTARYVKGNHAGKPGFTDDVRNWNGSPWTRKKGTAAAARPGTSNHGSGRAIDVKTHRNSNDPPHSQAVIFSGWNDADRLRFLRVAKKHGWDDAEGHGVNEHWHITYYPSLDQHRTSPVAGTVTKPGSPNITPPTPKDEDDMTPEEARKAAREGTHDYFASVANRDTSWARTAGDTYYDAQRTTDNRSLAAMANGSDSGGRTMRDYFRTLFTGGNASTNTTAEFAALSAKVDQLLSQPAGTPGGSAPIDYDKLAKAVNDDAARRMKE